MESQHACINNNAAVLSPSTPSRKILIRIKNPVSSIILNNGERRDDKAVQKSSVSKLEKTRGKRVFDVECKNRFSLGFNKDTMVHANDFEPECAQVFKKTKKQTDVWNHVNAVAANNKAPAAVRVKEVQKTEQQYMDIRKDLLWRFVNAQGKPACPICQENFVSNKFLYQHMARKSDKEWKTFIASLNTHNINKSGENQTHDAMVVDLTKFLPGWDMMTGKRGRYGSRVADVMVNKGPNTKEYLGLIDVDRVEMNEEDIQAAETIVLMSRDYLSNTRKSMMMTQREVESSVHVKDSATTTSGELKAVLDIDLNEPPTLEDDGSVTMA